ncbi:TetR/AcrR family transcriptional regulator [Vallitalea sediminicola]
MKEITINQTQEWIISALLELMDKKNYREITIVDIASKAHISRRTFYRHFKTKDDILVIYCNVILKDFAQNIRSKDEMTVYTVSLSYFEFWNQHLDFLKLLRKSDMLYFVGDRLPEFMAYVAVLVDHLSLDQIDETRIQQDKYYYAHYFNIGGYWSITTLWMDKEQRETPEQMATIMEKIIFRQL